MVTRPTHPPCTVSKCCQEGAMGDPHAKTLVGEAAPLAQLHSPFQSLACPSGHDRRDPHPSSTLPWEGPSLRKTLLPDSQA